MNGFKMWDNLGRSLFRSKLRKIYQSKWKNKGKTQAEFAERINELIAVDGKQPKCNHRQVSTWLAGKSVPWWYIRYICEALQVPEHELEPVYILDDALGQYVRIQDVGRAYEAAMKENAEMFKRHLYGVGGESVLNAIHRTQMRWEI